MASNGTQLDPATAICHVSTVILEGNGVRGALSRAKKEATPLKTDLFVAHAAVRSHQTFRTSSKRQQTQETTFFQSPQGSGPDDTAGPRSNRLHSAPTCSKLFAARPPHVHEDVQLRMLVGMDWCSCWAPVMEPSP